MVQLKDKYHQPIPIFVYISIPNGSIKSKGGDIREAVFKEFQFLMVQLKANIVVRQLH